MHFPTSSSSKSRIVVIFLVALTCADGEMVEMCLKNKVFSIEGTDSSAYILRSKAKIN